MRRIPLGHWEARGAVRVWIDDTERFKHDWLSGVRVKVMARRFGMGAQTVCVNARRLGLPRRYRRRRSATQTASA